MRTHLLVIQANGHTGSNTTSSGTSRGNAYVTTKAALEAHTVNLAAELRGTGVTVTRRHHRGNWVSAGAGWPGTCPPARARDGSCEWCNSI
jgi:hypothetical protein